MSNLNDYEGKHRDNSPEAITRGLDLDHKTKWSAVYPCTHHHARHSAFTCKVREVAA